MKRIRSGAGRSRQQPRIGAPDPALTPNAGLAVITELCDRLGVIGALDAAVGPVKQRDRGFGAGELLAGLAAAQLAGEDFLTGLDRQRADAAGQQLTPVPGLASTTAAGLARRVTPAQWRAVESGLAAVTGRMLALLPAPRAAALAVMATMSASNFGGRLTHTDGLYFTVTVLSTVGFGDITAKTEAARLVVTGQMIADLVILAVAVKIVVGAVSRGRQSGDAGSG